MIEVTVSDERIRKLLANAAAKFAPFASRAILAAEQVVKSIIQVYPPQPSRTRAKHFNTYVRGVGQYPRSSFIADASEPGGYRTKRTKRASIRMTSQQLDKRWQMSVFADGDEVKGELRNTANYSGYVNGFEEGEVHQVSFHTESGWVSADEAIEKARPEINRLAEQTAQDFADKISG
jgi:hypothetical protein